VYNRCRAYIFLSAIYGGQNKAFSMQKQSTFKAKTKHKSQKQSKNKALSKHFQSILPQKTHGRR